MKGYMYILLCSNGSYYTGSTNNLDLRLQQHQAGEGANHTKKYGPVELMYFEEFSRIDEAFNREKQVQGWNRKKKEALIQGMPDELKKLAECINETHCRNFGFDSAQPPDFGSAQPLDFGSAQPLGFEYRYGFDSAQPPLAPNHNQDASTLPERSPLSHQVSRCLSAPRCLSGAEGNIAESLFIIKNNKTNEQHHNI